MGPLPPYEVGGTPFPQQLKEGEMIKRRQSIFVEEYMIKPESGLDGSINGALDISPALVQRSEKRVWVRAKTVPHVEDEEGNLIVVFKDTAAEVQRFKDAIDEYQRIVEPKYQLSEDLTKAHDISSLLKSIDTASIRYKVDAIKGPWGNVREAFRKLGKNQAAIKAWLSFIPSEHEYFSILCGGLTVILGAAARMAELNAEIASALEEIPITLEHMNRIQNVFKESPSVQRRGAELYVAILQCLSHILLWYKRHSTKKNAFKEKTKVIFQQSSYSEALAGKIQNIKDSSRRFKDEAAVHDYELSTNTNKEVRFSNLKLDAMDENLLSVKEDLADIRQDVRDVIKEEILRALALNYFNSHLEAGLASDEYFRGPLIEDVKHLQSLGIEKRYKQGASIYLNLFPSNMFANTEQKSNERYYRNCLIESLTDERSISTSLEDLNNILPIGRTLPLAEQNRAVALMQSTRFHEWFLSAVSSGLIVNGNCDYVQRQSPMSFVAAKLASSLYKSVASWKSDSPAKLIVLHFFCGEHVDGYDDVDASPAGLLCSLLRQLVRQHASFKLAKIIQKTILDSSDVNQLLDIFSTLIRQLPENFILFCIIDGLSYYDDQMRGEETSSLIKRLASLSTSKEDRKRCVFKLLLTTSRRLMSTAVDECFGWDEILTLQARVPNKGGFTDLKWELKLNPNSS